METKTITFGIITEAVVHQSFEIPKNFSVKNKSIQDLYQDVRLRFGDENTSDVLTGDVDPFEFGVDNLGFNGFVGFTTEKKGKTIDTIY
nr:hypothetical protein [uncultured Flavobacterium sp.]